MIFAWKNFVGDGVVIAEDIHDAANKLKARQGINSEDFLLSEMIQVEESVYYFNQQFFLTEGVARERGKLWEYCLRLGGEVSENIVDYTLVRFTQPVPDERGLEFMKERYKSLSDYDDDEDEEEGW